MEADFPLLPCTHSLVPNDMLKVHVFDYKVESNNGRIIPAIGYKTEGFMSTFGQKEMVLILVVGGNDYDDDDDDENWVPPSLLAFSTSIMGSNRKKKKKKKKRRKFSYEEPLHFFRQLFGITSQSTVEHGSCTKFAGNGGLFGSSAILYAEMSSTAPASAAAAAASAIGGRASSRRDLNNEDNNLAYYSSYDEDCLAMLLLYGEEESSALTTFGHLRLMGLLGHKQGYYPYPYWSELQRPSLFENCIVDKNNTGNASSTLSSCSALGMFTGRIFLPPTSTFTHYPKQKKLVLKMKKKIRTLNGTDIWRDSNTNDGSFFDDTHELPRPETPTILLPGCIEENADGCYVRTIPERRFQSNNNNKRQQQVKKKKKKKTTITTGSPTRMPSLLSSLSYRSLSSSYNELLDDDNRINNNALSTQHDYYYYHDDDMISRDKNMACCFLALVGHSDKNIAANHYRMMEDGFFVYLTDTTWNEFWNHLMRNYNQNYQIQLTEGMVLALEWVS